MKKKSNKLITQFNKHTTLYVLILLCVLFIVVARMRWYDAWIGITADTEKSSFQANIGIYDPEKSFASSTSIALEHIFIQWNSFDIHDVESDLKNIIYANRWPLVTIEPFSRNAKGSSTLINDVVSGEYDSAIKKLCGVFAKVNHPLFVRWGHEMEIVNGRYPWATYDFENYIQAYRRMVGLCRSIYSETYFVWSPAGDPKLTKYWPGGEYVDYVGLSVYEYPLWDESYYGHDRNFREIFDEKYTLVSIYKKPIMIAEFGVTGSPQFQKEWLYGAFQVFDEYPLLKTVIYFNSKDHAGVWGKDLPIPDWRIDSLIFEK